MTLLAATGLRKTFGGIQAVAGVSLSVAPGEMVALIGPNGAGKTTCFNLLAGQTRPDSGRVRLDGRDITGLPPRAIWRLGVGRTFQITATFGSLAVRENVQTAMIADRGETWRPWGAARSRHMVEADALLDRVGLLSRAPVPAATLAYGDLKRLDLAMAIAHRPRLLLMDEPTAGMALADRTALMRLVRDLAKARALGVLFTEHDVPAVFAFADRIIVLHQGAVLAEGLAADIRANPAVQEAYLGRFD